MRVQVDVGLCCGSAECVRVCPENAISLINGKAVIDAKKCDLDGLCIPACPRGAIAVEEDEFLGGCGF